MGVAQQRRGTIAGSSGYVFPQGSTVLDNFNRADGAVGANYTTVAGVTMNVVSNTAGATGGVSFVRWVGASYTANQEAWITASTLNGTDDIIGLMLRCNVTTFDGYFLYYDKTLTEWQITKRVAGAHTGLVAPSGASMASGDKLGASAFGTSIKMYKFSSGSWAEVASVTDSSFTGAGHVGIISYRTDSRMDDFSGGSIT